MNSTEFLAKVADVLEYEGSLATGQSLEDIEVWDSLGILSVVDLLEEIGADVDIEQLSNLVTTDDLIAIAGSAVSD
jgi:acyl carrier protein